MEWNGWMEPHTLPDSDLGITLAGGGSPSCPPGARPLPRMPPTHTHPPHPTLQGHFINDRAVLVACAEEAGVGGAAEYLADPANGAAEVRANVVEGGGRSGTS